MFFVLTCCISLFYPHFAHVIFHLAAFLAPSVKFLLAFLFKNDQSLDPGSPSGPRGGLPSPSVACTCRWAMKLAVKTPFSSPSSAFNQQMTVSEFPPREFQTAPEVAAHKFNRHLLKQDI